MSFYAECTQWSSLGVLWKVAQLSNCCWCLCFQLAGVRATSTEVVFSISLSVGDRRVAGKSRKHCRPCVARRAVRNTQRPVAGAQAPWKCSQNNVRWFVASTCLIFPLNSGVRFLERYQSSRSKPQQKNVFYHVFVLETTITWCVSQFRSKPVGFWRVPWWCNMRYPHMIACDYETVIQGTCTSWCRIRIE